MSDTGQKYRYEMPGPGPFPLVQGIANISALHKVINTKEGSGGYSAWAMPMTLGDQLPTSMLNRAVRSR